MFTHVSVKPLPNGVITPVLLSVLGIENKHVFDFESLPVVQQQTEKMSNCDAKCNPVSNVELL